MHSASQLSSSFSHALHRAIDNSPLSLSQIVSKLSERGLKISRTTLSQWQTGASAPRRTSSKILVEELEKILDTPPHTLTDLIDDATHTGSAYTASPSPSTPPTDSPFTPSTPDDKETPIYINASNEEHLHTYHNIIDHTREATREVTEENMVISPDYRTLHQSISSLVRIPDTKRPTLHITAWWTENDTLPSEDDIGIYDIQGAFVTSTQVKQFEDGLAKISCLEFPPYVLPGSIHSVSYKIDFHSDEPMTQTTERIFSSKLRYYSCTVTFEGEPPTSLYWVRTHGDSQSSRGATHVTTERVIEPYNGSAQVTIEDAEYGTAVFQWE